MASLVSKLSDTVSSEIGKVSGICPGWLLCTCVTKESAEGTRTVGNQLRCTAGGPGLTTACLLHACQPACHRLAAEQPHFAARLALFVAVRSMHRLVEPADDLQQCGMSACNTGLADMLKHLLPLKCCICVRGCRRCASLAQKRAVTQRFQRALHAGLWKDYLPDHHPAPSSQGYRGCCEPGGDCWRGGCSAGLCHSGHGGRAGGCTAGVKAT